MATNTEIKELEVWTRECMPYAQAFVNSKPYSKLDIDAKLILLLMHEKAWLRQQRIDEVSHAGN
jgi:hypothetical protein